MSNVMLLSNRSKARQALSSSLRESLPVISDAYRSHTVLAEQSHMEPDLTWATATELQASFDLHITFLSQQFSAWQLLRCQWAHSDPCTSLNDVAWEDWLISEMKENSILPIWPLFVVSFSPGEQNLQTHLHRNIHVKKRWHLQKEQTKMLLVSDSQTKGTPLWKSTAAAIMSLCPNHNLVEQDLNYVLVLHVYSSKDVMMWHITY